MRPGTPAGPPAAPTARPVGGGWLDILVFVTLGALTAGLAVPTPLVAGDIWLRDVVDRNRPYLAELVAFLLNHLGQGLPLTLLCLGVALLLARRWRTVEPLLPVVSAFLLSYLSIGAVKLLTDRAAPHYGPALLFAEPDGRSFPSGHAANTVVWYGVLVMLLAPFLRESVRRLLRYGPLVLVSVATTYLGYHWLTDTVAGLLIGVLVDRAVRRAPWRRWRWLMAKLNGEDAVSEGVAR